ncbi:hypothetical protein GALMADRAFT_240373 [Galerina marginata CBS 339.88]|uniref:Cytochrome P450 n=1 Tax=Galerina marginata (strain CBS 339.88) TaxID=685588 RepID=A0A067TI36_GALM3|nr:hypothetical protein GALMADRAFT_240373 [Galerina marginata CBS 339.88]
MFFKESWSVGQLAFSLVATLPAYLVYKLCLFIYGELTSPLLDLPGPPSKSLIFGNFKDVTQGDSSEVLEKWIEEYGSTIKYKGFLGKTLLYTADLKAINHILMNSNDYTKPEVNIYIIKRVLGDGIILAEGEAHRKQRKVLNPAFGPQQMRDINKVFVEKSLELRDMWTREIQKQQLDGAAMVDSLSWFSRLALDVIGIAGFNYNFDSLSDDPEKDEFGRAFSVTSKMGRNMNVMAILKYLIPAISFLPGGHDPEEEKAADTVDRIGAQLLNERKAAAETQGKDNKSWESRDILSLLVRANSMPDLPENQRLSDRDVLGQIPTFMSAGHETTSISSTWAFYALSQNKDAQTKLREELMTISTDNPTMDELNSLPYLDTVVRESLRLYAPVPETSRVAAKDDFLPLSKPFIDRHGKLHHELRMKKGQSVAIPIIPINRAKALWGEDAKEFKPERWENLPEEVSAIPGVWGNMMTFIGGPRACIGYRFSIVEMKAILFTLIRAFEFDLAVPANDIIISSKAFMQRPVLRTETDPKKLNQLPLLVRLVGH